MSKNKHDITGKETTFLVKILPTWVECEFSCDVNLTIMYLIEDFYLQNENIIKKTGIKIIKWCYCISKELKKRQICLTEDENQVAGVTDLRTTSKTVQSEKSNRIW